MHFAVGPVAAGAGHRVFSHERIDSTNSEAMRLARAGERGPVWIVAGEQTAGRGRRGREWVSLEGNLFATLLIRERMNPSEAATLGFVASLAVYGACRACAQTVPLTLKWPNDVLAEGRKIAGILMESEAISDGLAIAIGFGINLAAAPRVANVAAGSLADFDFRISPQAIFTHLTDAFVARYGTWARGEGFRQIRTEWLAHAHGVGQPITVQMGPRAEPGVFEALDEEGRLILRSASGKRALISAGDVYFGAAGTLHSRAGVA